jgi:hypothetical protein
MTARSATRTAVGSLPRPRRTSRLLMVDHQGGRQPLGCRIEVAVDPGAAEKIRRPSAGAGPAAPGVAEQRATDAQAVAVQRGAATAAQMRAGQVDDAADPGAR